MKKYRFNLRNWSVDTFTSCCVFCVWQMAQ